MTPDRVDALLRSRLHRLRTTSGLPVVLSGTTRHSKDGPRLRVTGLLGTIGRGLDGLELPSGRGMGGTVVATAEPCRVNDYADSAVITHDFDDVVVAQERIRSIFALPVMVRGRVRGVLYGATRDSTPIGDVALRHASQAAAALSRDAAVLLAQPPPPPAAVQALDELGSLARSVVDPHLREQLGRIHRELARGGDRTRPGSILAPRELDALRLVEVGASNTVIAEQLGISLQTVKAYLHSAMRKLDVHNRTSAVHTARVLGLL